MTRRKLLGTALGAALLGSGLEAANAVEGDSPPLRECFDFDWKFFKGDMPGAQVPNFEDSAVLEPRRFNTYRVASIPISMQWIQVRLF